MRGKSRGGRAFPSLGLRRDRQAGNARRAVVIRTVVVRTMAIRAVAIRARDAMVRAVIVRAAVISSNDRRHGIVTAGTERLAAGKAPRSEPCSTERPVADHRFAGVIGARRKKPARPGKIWRDQQSVAPYQR